MPRPPDGSEWGCSKEGLCLTCDKATQASVGRLASCRWWQGHGEGGDPQAACAASRWSRCPPPPTPCLGLALCIKFKGFKCKYFSFIDASCLQRACFLAAQLYCPISFPYLGTGEPGGLGEGVSRGRGAEAPELEAAPQGTVSGPVGSPGQRGWGGEGAPPKVWGHLSDSKLQRERQRHSLLI